MKCYKPFDELVEFINNTRNKLTEFSIIEKIGIDLFKLIYHMNEISRSQKTYTKTSGVIYTVPLYDVCNEEHNLLTSLDIISMRVDEYNCRDGTYVYPALFALSNPDLPIGFINKLHNSILETGTWDDLKKHGVRNFTLIVGEDFLVVDDIEYPSICVWVSWLRETYRNLSLCYLNNKIYLSHKIEELDLLTGIAKLIPFCYISLSDFDICVFDEKTTIDSADLEIVEKFIKYVPIKEFAKFIVDHYGELLFALSMYI